MNALKRQFEHAGAIKRKAWQLLTLAVLGSVCALANAQENAIESITANQQGANVIVKVKMKNPVSKPPIGFSITNPARIALDFPATANETGVSSQNISLGDVRNVNVVQAGERSRLVFNLQRPLNYATAVEGNAVVVTIDGSGGVATAVNMAGKPVAMATSAAPSASKSSLLDIDFRRGSAGEGRVVVNLPSNQVGVDVRQQGQTIVVDFLKTRLPDVLRRRMDVTDFGTPVQSVVATPQGENVRMVIAAKGMWEHSAYQSDTQLVVEVKPIKEDPNKLTQGTQGYRGERLSLNFQNVEVRAVLQVIADFTGLNIITSDTVTGNLTLRLKDVPWDQALDIVMQAKGLDMRKNGTVLWIAPKDELLTKEKLELEQKAQIAELEPVKTEIFQLNYQKAESFKQVFALDGGSGANNNRILSKRGSAVIDPRTNQLFVTDIPSKLEEVRKLIQKTDVASRQVLIEARIVEASDTFSKDLGAKLGFGLQRSSRGGNNVVEAGGQQNADASAPGINLNNLQTVNGNNINLPAISRTGNPAGSIALSLFNAAATRFISLELSALEADGKGKIISSPRIVTADQLKALIEQGTELPYQQATSSGATSVAFKKANLKLEVTPQITPDGNVILDVDVTKDSPGQNTNAGPAINTKHVQTKVMVDNGGTIVLGGIYTQEERKEISKVPLLGDIPVVGNLFKNTSQVNDKTELLIFLTPKILNDKLTVR
ncbi:type IV pilus assembly protein PilQ [Paucimonas lemoignei]|uniref:Type IV pilus biogenesis and competence protein PilQ n=1 Tax=Paucimonas lemoignei TaxID=29443 RepID=A0A4R3HWW4_PAULE|nr:type IV pilus secretin PilQ family protein [Paucimonas lemoignei]TCS37284.1 type IV pilus assembly protein PilQ [Paucimonas lemoignei]